MKEEFNNKQIKEDPARHSITGNSYKKSVSDRPMSKDRTDRIERVKKIEKEYNEKNQKLGEIRRRKIGNNQPAPGLHPPGMGGGPNAQPPNHVQTARNRDRIDKVQKRLDEKYKEKAGMAERKDRAKEAFKKAKQKGKAKEDFNKVK